MVLKTTHSKKALTAVELLLIAMIFSIIVAVIYQVIIFTLKYSKVFQTESSLQQESVLISRHMKAKIAGSPYCDIDNTAKTLTLYDSTGAVKSTYTLSGNTLSYGAEVLSDKVTSVSYDDMNTPGNTTGVKALKADIVLSQTTGDTTRSLAFFVAATARLPGVSKSVRLVAFNRTTVKGFYNNIQAAINAAIDTDIVQVSSNSKVPYGENLTITNKSISLEGAYDSNDWTRHLDDPAYDTIIDGQQLGRVIFCDLRGGSGNYTVAISGFTIVNGSGGWVYDAGGIYAEISRPSCSLLIEDNIIKNNLPSVQGNMTCGAILASIGDLGVITIKDNKMTDNGANGGCLGVFCSNGSRITIHNNLIDRTNQDQFRDTGAIFCQTGTDSLTFISNNIISNNKAAQNSGGISATAAGGGRLYIANNQIHDNLGGAGGGISVQCSSNGVIRIYNNEITSNHSNHRGAGILASSYSGTGGTGTIEIFSNTIKANDAYNILVSPGGGIHATAQDSNCAIWIHNNIIADNIRSSSGIWCKSTLSGKIIMENNLITGHQHTVGPGSGIYVDAATDDTGKISITNNTVTGNSSSVSGGGFYNASGSPVAFIRNSIIYGNLPADSNLAGSANVAYSDVEGYTTGTPAAPDVGKNWSADPLFIGALDYRLQATANGNPADSPCIDRGEPLMVFYDPSSSVPTLPDTPALAPARGYVINDMGAYGGPGAANPIGAFTVADDLATADIREDVIGTY